jgi:hypothetical protein
VTLRSVFKLTTPRRQRTLLNTGLGRSLRLCVFKTIGAL